MSNYIQSKVWDEITYPFANFNGCISEVWECIKVISSHTLLDMWLLSDAGIKVYPCQQKGSQDISCHGTTGCVREISPCVPQEFKITLTILVPDEWMTSVSQSPFSKQQYRLRSRMPRACHIFTSSFRFSALVTCHQPRWNSDCKWREKYTQIILTDWKFVSEGPIYN